MLFFILVVLLVGCAVLDRIGLEAYSETLAWEPASIFHDVHELTLRAGSGTPREIAEYIATQMQGV